MAKLNLSSIGFAILQLLYCNAVIAIHWDHSKYLDENFRILWSTKNQEITFEIQVRTLGYIGLGFSRDGSRYGSDIAIGWVDKGQIYFQDRHIKMNGEGEPFVDSSQDYVLLLGYENSTHTVMRFRRKLDTCDTSHDIPITNDTMRIIYMYHKDDPLHGSVVPGSLPNPYIAFRDSVPLSLIQRVHETKQPRNTMATMMDTMNVNALELNNVDVTLPQADDTLYWCRVFELHNFNAKQHIIKYEPIYETSKSKDYLQRMILRECQGTSAELELMSRGIGKLCYARNSPITQCNTIVAAWFRGSEGFTFPMETGYPLDTSIDRFFMLETHYNNPNSPKDLESLHMGPVVDNSGLKLYYTSALRKHDAGVMSVGIDPNWRHIIPPGHDKVISEGHCIDDCTRNSFLKQGISIFAVIMQTNNIGREVKFRQIRKHEELLPIAYDSNIHSEYSEYRRISPPAKVLPGDRLITECTYNSSERSAITLGGLTNREERCNVLAVYYPRQKKLTTCHSSPSLPTVLHSLGIDEIAIDSNPVLIASPLELSGMTLESRLLSYDWANQFDSFQRITRAGAFKPVCLDARGNFLAGTQNLDRFSPNLNKFWRAPISQCGTNKPSVRLPSADQPYIPDSRNVYVTEMATNRLGTSEAESLGLSASNPITIINPIIVLLAAYIVSVT